MCVCKRNVGSRSGRHGSCTESLSFQCNLAPRLQEEVIFHNILSISVQRIEIVCEHYNYWKVGSIEPGFALFDPKVFLQDADFSYAGLSFEKKNVLVDFLIWQDWKMKKLLAPAALTMYSAHIFRARAQLKEVVYECVRLKTFSNVFDWFLKNVTASKRRLLR